MLAAVALMAATSAAPALRVETISHADLMADDESAHEVMKRAFVGNASFGLLIVKDIPGFAEARHTALNATLRMFRDPPTHSLRPRNSWPGFRHPDDVLEPLQ